MRRNVPPAARLAGLAYLLACLGSMSFIVRALGWIAGTSRHHLPFGWLAAWWALAAATPLGVLLAEVALITIYRKGRSGQGIPRAYAALAIGFLTTLAITGGTREIDGTYRELYHRESCIGNVKQLSIGLRMYAQDWNERFPVTEQWHEGLWPYIKNENVFRCPDEENEGEPSYAINRLMRGLNVEKVQEPDKTITLFDSIPGKNRAGGPELLPDPPRHKGGHVVGYLDGHAKRIEQSEIADLRWHPTVQPPPKTPVNNP